MKGLSECKALESNIRRIRVKDIVKEVKDYLKIYSSAGMDISSVVDENLPQLLDSRGGSHIVNVPAFDKEDFTINGTFTRLKCLLNDLENNGVCIPQVEVNATFVNSLPRKWLSMNQTQRANNSIKMIAWPLCMASTIMRKDSDSDVEEDQRTSNEFMADLNAEYHERALLANQKRFYKRSDRVGSARKPLGKSKKTCFAYGKLGHFQKDCPSNKTSTPSYPSSNN
ncbi:retrovirus-related pol polyprotein from transposon TNT 1-94 [Tanacetum coccineum]